jgi:gamma-polyglutamate biosynthesis protein CapA
MDRAFSLMSFVFLGVLGVLAVRKFSFVRRWIVSAGVAFLLARCLCGCRPQKHETRTSEAEVTLVAVGDILLDRGVGKQIVRFGADYPFERVGGLLREADIAFGNLECPLAAGGEKVKKRYSFRAKPEMAESLARAGFDLLSLANNHTMDCGRIGLTETMENLSRPNLRWCGAGKTRSEAEMATVLEVQGIRVAFVGFCEFVPERAFPRDDRPTILFAEEETVRRVVSAARPQADVVIASFHWGIEFDSRPTEFQKGLARAAVESGADIVLGHHPHVLQPLEVMSHNGRRALIAYSLGNFVFDPTSSAPSRSMILRCTFGKNGLHRAEVLPMQIEQCRPRPAEAAETETIRSRLTSLSGERATILQPCRESPDRLCVDIK